MGVEESISLTRGGHALRASLRRQSAIIVGLYALVAGSWIALSDKALGALVQDAETLVQISLIKGIGFVTATAGLLYLLLRRSFRRVEAAFGRAEEHKEQRRRAEAIVASTSDAIVSRTMAGVITSWNSAAETMFGYTAAEIIGTPVKKLIAGEQVEEEALITTRMREGKRIEQIETTRVSKDGTEIPVAITFSPIAHVDGAGSRARM